MKTRQVNGVKYYLEKKKCDISFQNFLHRISNLRLFYCKSIKFKCFWFIFYVVDSRRSVGNIKKMTMKMSLLVHFQTLKPLSQLGCVRKWKNSFTSQTTNVWAIHICPNLKIDIQKVYHIVNTLRKTVC